jgi:hypothetical protein
MYTNILRQDTMNIIKGILKHEQQPNINTQEIIIILTIIQEQDFFQFNNKTYKQKHGLCNSGFWVRFTIIL